MVTYEQFQVTKKQDGSVGRRRHSSHLAPSSGVSQNGHCQFGEKRPCYITFLAIYGHDPFPLLSILGISYVAYFSVHSLLTRIASGSFSL
ncbi:unnamed protein product [Rhizoctonia solani]|uniref:Transmembrane protein n=1 Tax=Rhizoctonia solani TaxID=456999 RepID=A0A8H2XAG2_9AGAM|nr:unnamed protein product [Rhizoctonia solani]